MGDPFKVRESSKIGDADQAEAVFKLQSDLKALCSAKDGGVSGICLVDVSERLARLLASVEQASFVIDHSLAKKVHEVVVRLLTKPTIGRGTTIKLTRTGIDTTRRVLTTVTRALAVGVKSRGGKSRGGRLR